MGKSLTEVARSIVESNDTTPDRDAKKKTPNADTLRPGSKFKEPSPMKNAAKLVATAPVDVKDQEEFAPAIDVKKDTSMSSRAAVGPEPMHKLSEEMEEAIIAMMEEGMSDEEIEAVIAEALDEDRLEEETLESFINSALEEGLAEGYSEEEILEAIEQHLSEKNEIRDDLIEMIDSNEETGIEEEDESPYLSAAKEVTDFILEDADSELSISEDVEALLEGEDLSEEFKHKAQTIFEAAVAARVEDGIAILEEKYAAALEESTKEIYAQLHEEIDGVLNAAIDQWMDNNEVAIESGLRAELSEEFISGLRQLFMEHYVDIPENEISVVDALGGQVQELEAALNEEIERNVSLTNKLNGMAKHEIVSAISEGLTTTQTEKLYALAEGVDFTDPEEYAEKMLTLRESYFPQSVGVSKALDSADDLEPLNEDNSRIQKYAKAIVGNR